MDENQNTLQSALELHQEGSLDQAEPAYRKLLAVDPNNMQVRFLLGTCLLQLNRYDESISILEPLTEQPSAGPDVFNNLGIAYRATGNLEAAVSTFQQAIKSNPEYSQAYFNLGELLETGNALKEAAQCYRKALELTPTDHQAGAAFARVLTRMKNWADAENIYRQILSADPQNEEYLVQLAFVLASSKRVEEALEIYQDILSRKPDFAEIMGSVCYLYEKLGQFSEARRYAKQALDIKPDYAEGWNNLGSVALAEHQPDEAIQNFKKAAELVPELSIAHYNVATTQLLQEKYEAGWTGYEYRLNLTPTRFPQYAEGNWRGEAITGKRLVIIADQGFGDTIQFSRFLKRAKEMSQADITFLCHEPLVSLLAPSLKEVGPVVATIDNEPSFDYQLPLCSLPGLLGIHQPDKISQSGYVELPGSASVEVTTLVRELDTGLKKVGLVWRGNPEQDRDQLRSCPLEKLKPLFNLSGIQWVNLQIDEQSRTDLESLQSPARFLHAGHLVNDFRDTGWLLKQLDLVLSVDTAVAHLAGALGLPVWTMLCHTPDWRWRLTGEESTWYPQMRLIRQPAWSDWDSVIAQIAQELPTA
ncbi:TPR repeat-containing protein YrrB [Polystyrenella longa]|uniref:TPR repeat-containing protein YrrB n=1 Tax=Polystyrenella longa TaxID=2528007 RepID=A0A518CLS4_9PLAN|nr:tetratricopeptide repeat protein [Polystyrenella longa]QDU80191.1 TPR repeat-containing protein YrrB [Polystyrenella longa]